MAKPKTTDSIIKTPGTIRGILKRKKIYELKDPELNEIPIDYIKDHLIVKDNFVREIAELWSGIFFQIKHLKKLLLVGGPAMYEMLKEAGDVRSDSKGGFTEYDFGRNIKVLVSYSLRYDWDHDLMKQASDHFDKWLQKHGETPVTKAFRKAFQQQNGNYDIKMLNRLTQLQETDEDFLKAMVLKNEAQTSTPTKLKTTLEIRNEEGEFVALPLSISHVSPGSNNEFTFRDEISDQEFIERIINPGTNNGNS